jgi:CRP-like cAMP-binding protein
MNTYINSLGGQHTENEGVNKVTSDTATAEASLDSVVAVLSQADFNDLINNQPYIGLKILIRITQLISSNLRKTNNRLVEYMMPLS